MAFWILLWIASWLVSGMMSGFFTLKLDVENHPVVLMCMIFFGPAFVAFELAVIMIGAAVAVGRMIRERTEM
jgi:hypothetical protein